MKSGMRRNRRNKNNGGTPETTRIHFEFASPTAESVAVAGSFNDWRPNATPMIALGQGRWVKDLTLPPGTYEYCLVVDGAWMADPLVQDTVPNPFGGANSVLRVSAPA